ncbi:MAG: hypothetical protein AAFR75_05505, partial [Pseudomonadota bacterium]
GGEADDVLDGGAGDDVLSGGAGEDLIDGGRGHDVAVLAGVAEDYTVTSLESGVLFTNGAGETDLLTNIEHVRFTDSSDVYAITDGALVLSDHSDDVNDLLEGDLLAEILDLNAGVGSTDAGSVDEALAEMAEMEASGEAAVPTEAVVPATDISDDSLVDPAMADMSADEGMRVA